MGFVAGFMNADDGEPSYDAASMRMIEAASMTPWAADPVGVRTGVRPSRGPAFAVTIPENEMTYSVSPGIAVISKSDVAAPGGYFIVSDAANEGAVQDRDATYPRIDAVFLRVNDSDHDTSESKGVELGYHAGIPAADPVTPEGYEDANDDTLLLAYITVPQIGGGNITVADKRHYTVSSGGVLPVSGAFPVGNFHEGQMVYRRDYKQINYTDGNTWYPFPKMRVGNAIIPVAKNQSSGSKAISFPSGFFQVDPRVLTTWSGNNTAWVVGTQFSTKTGATLVATNKNGNPVSSKVEVPADWVAIGER